jgi:hypothetical protein
MSQFNLFLDKDEAKKVSKLKEKWNMSKHETIKKIIRDFKEKKK